MRYGFKTLAEKASAAARAALNLGSNERLDPWQYAKHIGVVILEFDALDISSEAATQLTRIDGDSWSAMTLKEGDHLAIVLNPAHAATRQMNDLMHELAHIDLRHTPVRVDVSKNGLLLLSDYSDEQEQEADWYAAAMLLPRAALMHHRSRGKSAVEIAEIYGVSVKLCTWRLRTTGVEVQMRRSYSSPG